MVIDQYKQYEVFTMGTLLRDLKSACKLLVCNPRFAVAALAVLVIGIATNSSAFMFVARIFAE